MIEVDFDDASRQHSWANRMFSLFRLRIGRRGQDRRPDVADRREDLRRTLPDWIRPSSPDPRMKYHLVQGRLVEEASAARIDVTRRSIPWASRVCRQPLLRGVGIRSGQGHIDRTFRSSDPRLPPPCSKVFQCDQAELQVRITLSYRRHRGRHGAKAVEAISNESAVDRAVSGPGRGSSGRRLVVKSGGLTYITKSSEPEPNAVKTLTARCPAGTHVWPEGITTPVGSRSSSLVTPIPTTVAMPGRSPTMGGRSKPAPARAWWSRLRDLRRLKPRYSRNHSPSLLRPRARRRSSATRISMRSPGGRAGTAT